jgi:hypothetical protein
LLISPFWLARQPAKSAKAAQQRYLDVLQSSLTCLSSSAVWYAAPPLSGRGQGRALAVSQDPIGVKRKKGAAATVLFASQRFDIQQLDGEWKVKTLEYIYRVATKNEPDGEYIAWHWHPLTTPDRSAPHLHVATKHAVLGAALRKLHVPTGRVSFEEVARFLITDLGVTAARNDWRQVLEDAESRFRTYRTWA